MPVQRIRIQDKFNKLPMAQKVIGVGSVLAIISSFLTWYKDIDAFDRGGAYLGITGPLYLIGYVIVCLSVFSLALTVFHLLEKKIPSLPIKESMVYIFSGATSLFLLVIANSIYFHPQFGLNITSKEYGIGMMIAFVGSVAITVGGVMQNRESGTSRLIKKFQEEAQTPDVNPVIELNNFQKEQEERKERLDVEPEKVKMPVKEPQIARPIIRSQEGGREYKAKSEGSTKVRMEPYPDASVVKTSTESKLEDDKVNPNSVIRMDL